jgi:transposase
MATNIRNDRSNRSQSSSRKKRSRLVVLQKPNGVIAPRVRNVGADKFGLVCVDPAKHRSEWLMADYFGNILIAPRTLEHTAAHLQQAVALVRQAMQQQDIRDVVVTVERTGSYHRPVQRAFAEAGFETRVVHPFAVKQYRLPADPGNKTDQTDLFAQHRAAIAGFGLIELPLSDQERRLRLLVRHRRDLVEKASALRCQIKEHLHLAMPGYTSLFVNFWRHGVALPAARLTGTVPAVLDAGRLRLGTQLRQQGIRFQAQTLDKVLAWAQSAPAGSPDALLHHRIWTDLDDLRLAQDVRIAELERDIAAFLVQTPYVLLLSIPGINVVSAGDLAGEMGPIAHYANANAITGRAGLFPSRYQSDQTDHDDGPLPRRANRRLRGALMRIADNLIKNNHFFRGKAALLRQQKVDERALRVKIAKNASRLIYALVAGRQPLRHPCCARPAAVLDKLRAFHQEHGTPADRLLADLHRAVDQLPGHSHAQEQTTLATWLEQDARRRTGPTPLAALLPAVLARLVGVPRPDNSNLRGNTALN